MLTADEAKDLLASIIPEKKDSTDGTTMPSDEEQHPSRPSPSYATGP